MTGDLDLSAVTVPFPLTFEGCRFESPLQVSGATLQELTVLLLRAARAARQRRGRAPGPQSVGVDGHRRGPHYGEPVPDGGDLVVRSQVGGRLLCVDTVIEPGDGRAIQADRIRVGGTVRLHDFTTGGEVRLLGARIDGSIDLTGAHLADAERRGPDAWTTPSSAAAST